MTTFKLFFASSISIVGIMGIIPSAYAGYTCSHNEFLGTTSCSGSINGQSVYTTTTHNEFLGTTTTTGTVGGSYYSETCSHNEFLGTTSCY
jgi:hypothetical protein